MNARLIAFLKEKETVKKLISFVIEPPKSWASERQQQRFPFIACEVQPARCTNTTLSFVMFADLYCRFVATLQCMACDIASQCLAASVFRLKTVAA